MEQGIYTIENLPTGLIAHKALIQMTAAELRRFCSETKNPLFIATVKSDGLASSHFRLFCLLNDAVLTATEV